MTGKPLPKAEYEEIFAKVPRLTVEVVIASSLGIVLVQRSEGPCAGLWTIPGGTVQYGEPLADAVQRVAHDEVGISVTISHLLGYVEYPSHLAQGIDWPVGIAFECRLSADREKAAASIGAGRWFTELPDEMHDEQRSFLLEKNLGGTEGPTWK